MRKSAIIITVCFIFTVIAGLHTILVLFLISFLFCAASMFSIFCILIIADLYLLLLVFALLTVNFVHSFVHLMTFCEEK